MKKIEFREENLMQVMYGLLLPAIGGTIFWYLIQHIARFQLLHTITSLVLVYYFVLHFLAGQQVAPGQYGKSGFTLDFIVIVAIEGLFYAIETLPAHHALGMVCILVILSTLLLWCDKSARTYGHSRAYSYSVLLTSMLAVITLWGLTYIWDDLDQYHSTLAAVVVLAVASTAILLFGASDSK